MFGRKSLPLGVLVMLMVLALASLGIGYGLWSKTLYVNGYVETGNVDAELSLGAVRENDHGKDVAECHASLLDLDKDGQPEKLHVEVENAYPCYECWVEFDVHSKGTIPVLVYQPIFTQVPPADEVTLKVVDCYNDPVQLHKSDVAWCTLYIHVEQQAKQNGSYLFTGDIEVRQFNEPR